MTEQNLIYVIGRNKEEGWHIYRCTREEAEKQNHMIFHTWQSARRHLKAHLAGIRNEIMANLFVIDKEIRSVEALKEVKSAILQTTKEPVFAQESERIVA